MANTDIPDAASLMACLEDCPRIMDQLRTKDSEYWGITVVQMPRSWARLGATWRIGDQLVVLGPGVDRWGTTLGLAELVAMVTADPKWHASGVVACSVEQAIVFAATKEVVEHLKLDELDEMASKLLEEDDA